MKISDVYTNETLTQSAKELFKEERAINRLDGWFRVKELQRLYSEGAKEEHLELKAARSLREVAYNLPIFISESAVFAGTQRDAFAKSYALINPSFEVESFSGYCDPTAVYDDIEPNDEISREMIENARKYDKDSQYVKKLSEVYAQNEKYTSEVIFFFEQVTGHLIPDMKAALASGVDAMRDALAQKEKTEKNEEKRIAYEAMNISLEAVLILARRYRELALAQAKTAEGSKKAALTLLAEALEKVPANGASNLYEAIQSYMLLWQVMCIEQTPNPFAFSVGNADRIFEPYRQKCGTDRKSAAALLKHFLVFFNVGDRSWAISQNIIVSGKDKTGADLTNETTYALLDAYYDMNLPQPILSVKLHKNTPKELYESLGRFFLTPGMLTPSLFNDDSLFEVLKKSGIDDEDLENYSIAGCQEPLIMGKDNGNTTNSWLNLGKILELTVSGGISGVTGKKIGAESTYADPVERLRNIRESFYENVEFYAGEMAKAANGASVALSNLRAPFLSVFMGGMEYGADFRDTNNQGTKYNGSGCLIHGLSVVSDSFLAIDRLLAERPDASAELVDALLNDYAGKEELRQYMLSAPKFGNNIPNADEEARKVAEKTADIVASQKNYLGNPFRPDFSTPSTHLLYGYWVGAAPDGRKSREALNYGVDPMHGDAQNGLGFRTLSSFCLPYDKMNGGYASHFGIDPKYFRGATYEENGMEFCRRVIEPLFFNKANSKLSPFYLYVNVTTAEVLRNVLAEPKKYAPNGVYIMRIHGTFVNFLDLSPAIQDDIITRLDPMSTAI